MDQLSIELSELFDLEEWQKLQDAMAMATKLAMVTSDYRGVPFSRGSNCSPFCIKARAHPQISKYCHRCDSFGGLEAAKRNAPYIYTCHLGIVDMAVPILIDGKYIGALIAGQIRIAEEDGDRLPEQLLVTRREGRVAEFLEENQNMYEGMPTLTMEEIYHASMLLYHVCRYITLQAAHRKGSEIGLPGGVEIPQTLLEDSRPTCGNPPPESKIEQEELVPRDHVLYPAFNYISQNRSLFPTQQEMAKLCHLSSGYFSRLFKKEAGTGYTEYLSGLKITWAKELLNNTDMTVSEISDRLGYSSPSYFIRIFRDHEHLTPQAFRTHRIGFQQGIKNDRLLLPLIRNPDKQKNLQNRRYGDNTPPYCRFRSAYVPVMGLFLSPHPGGAGGNRDSAPPFRYPPGYSASVRPDR